jgi:hypothetical protein
VGLVDLVDSVISDAIVCDLGGPHFGAFPGPLFGAFHQFEVIVPHMAKSAATLICFGASCIHMGPTAELGPVDPQVKYINRDIPYGFMNDTFAHYMFHDTTVPH